MDKEETFQRMICKDAIQADLRGSSVRSATYTAAAGLVSFFCRIGSTMILARLVLPEHFGLLAMVAAVVGFAEQFRDLGLSTATVQAKSLTRQQVSNLFWVNVSCGSLIALIVVALAPVLAWFYHDARLVPVTLAIALTPFLGGLGVQHQALLTRQLKLGRISSIRVGSALFSDLLGIGLAFAGAGYWALVIREITRNLFVLLGIVFTCRWLPALPARTGGMKNLFAFGGNLTAANMLSSLVGNADKILLGRYFGPAATGFYRQAQFLISAPMDQVVHPIFRVSEPGLSSLQHEPVRYRNYYRKILSMVSLLTMPLSVLVAVYAPECTMVLLGAKWLPSAELVRILAVSTFLTPSVWTSHLVLLTLGRGPQYLRLKIAENLVFLGLVGIGLQFGATGVAAVGPALMLLMMGPTLWYCFRDSPVIQSTFWQGIVKPLVASLFMLGVLLALNAISPLDHPLAAAVRGGVIGGIAYLACFCLLPGGLSEIRSLVGDIRTAFARKGGKTGKLSQSSRAGSVGELVGSGPPP
jgi:O-antigen/teichoic acid export membrane protein